MFKDIRETIIIVGFFVFTIYVVSFFWVEGKFAANIAIALSCAIAIALGGYWLSLIGGRIYRSQFLPDPWVKPFTVSEADPERFKSLLARLDEIETLPSEWAILLRDRETGQIWRRQSQEKGPCFLFPVNSKPYQPGR